MWCECENAIFVELKKEIHLFFWQRKYLLICTYFARDKISIYHFVIIEKLLFSHLLIAGLKKKTKTMLSCEKTSEKCSFRAFSSNVNLISTAYIPLNIRLFSQFYHLSQLEQICINIFVVTTNFYCVMVKFDIFFSLTDSHFSHFSRLMAIHFYHHQISA